MLLLHGDDDRVVPHSHSAWLAGHLPSAELWTSPHDGDGHLSAPSRAPAALTWLAEHTRRGDPSRSVQRRSPNRSRSESPERRAVLLGQSPVAQPRRGAANFGGRLSTKLATPSLKSGAASVRTMSASESAVASSTESPTSWVQTSRLMAASDAGEQLTAMSRAYASV